MADIGGMRTAYCAKTNVFLEESIAIKEPYSLFTEWFDEVKNNPAVVEPNAMCLATATKDGVPSARFVLCKGYNKDGFKFFTHYTSRKGNELEENPVAALTFFWAAYSRSVRIEGTVEKLPMSEADNYFNGRPYQSQIGALCSDQSKPVENRQYLENIESSLRAKYKEGEVPKPEFWGGYIVKPKSIEFWQGQTDRIHDRIKFFKDEAAQGTPVNKGEDGWSYQRLAP